MASTTLPLKTKHLHCILWGIFILYGILAIRIVLFQSAPLYNLFGAVGSGTRTVNFIPFASVAQMFQEGLSISRLLENILGNVVLFIPLGILLPTLFHQSYGKALCYGIGTSLLLETLQYLLAMGASDIDDVLLNTMGVLIGLYICWLLQHKLPTKRAAALVTTAILLVAGTISAGVLFFTNYDLFRISRPQVTTENAQLVNSFIETQHTASGTYLSFLSPNLTLQYAKKNAKDKPETEQFTLTDTSTIILCHNEITNFLGTLSKETLKYEAITPEEFTSRYAEKLKGETPLRLWSKDGIHVDSAVFYLVTTK